MGRPIQQSLVELNCFKKAIFRNQIFFCFLSNLLKSEGIRRDFQKYFMHDRWSHLLCDTWQFDESKQIWNNEKRILSSMVHDGILVKGREAKSFSN